MDQLCKRMRDRWSIAAITNDIYTREDAEFLMRSQALPLERIVGVETGGCPHTAIREDASINLAAVDELVQPLPRPRHRPDRVGRRQPLGHLLARARRPHALRHRRLRPATRSRARAAPASPAPTSSIINKTDLAPYVGASLEVMDRDARRMRGERPFQFAQVRDGVGVPEIVAFIETAGGLVR